MKTVLFFWLIPLQMYSQVQGKIRLEHYVFNSDEPTESYQISTMIWYNGKKSIQEVPHISIRTDSTGSYKNIYVEYYLFIDSGLGQYTYYRNFSDTSQVAIYSKGENPFEEYGGWNLYSNKKFDYDNTQRLNDTVIKGVNYGRNLFSKMNNGKTNDFILYSFCENKEIPIKYLKPFGEEIGCPVVRMDTFYDHKLVGTTELQYISDTLSAEELKVFDAWGRNARMNRVIK